MVISVKVKTLDSQTYDFDVEDEISVRQFKETISEKTNISAESQRIIYCGRVLVDDKPLKEYDVNGKVVHVVERPPPSARPPPQTSENASQRQRERMDVRTSPMFRALDGMVLSTMTIPVNRTEGQATQPTQTLNPSSTFCINRITVARHMLNCADNIASYLENPERGLNNSPMENLTQGRWTMESTVVEVGITTGGNIEIPQNSQQNLTEALRGAFSAALRQAPHPNLTVVQLPSMFYPNGVNSTQTEGTSQPSGESNETLTPNEDTLNETPELGATASPPDPANSESQDRNQTTSNSNQSNSNSPTSQRPRTGTRTLAEVVQQMRNVQTRLEPFIEQYYQLLLNDPTFEENDTTGRENAQRIFDRVSEALHYMSHAQHAISDLMLDMSQNTPRYLCCRPILVEQSGFVGSSNYLTSFLPPNGNNNEPAATNNNTSIPTQNGDVTLNANVHGARPFTVPFARVSASQQEEQSATSSPGEASSASTPSAPSAPPNVPSATSNPIPNRPGMAPTAEAWAAVAQGQSQNQRNLNARGLHSFFSPIFLPTANRSTTTTTTNANAENSGNNQASPQIHVARLIQAVVNSAPIDADLHVQINAPNLLTFGVPVTSMQTQQTSQNSSQQTNGANTPSDASNTEPGARVTTATHPTTSTQTRSTARPHVHVANLPSSQMWNARVIPANMLSSFDRFLPCNSHHIRESELPENNQPPNIFARFRNQDRQRRQQPTERTASTPRSTISTPVPTCPRSSSSDDVLNLLATGQMNQRSVTSIPEYLDRIKSEIQAFIVDNLFSGSPITDENMTEAVNQTIQQVNSTLVPPQFESDYDCRASVENFIRNTLPLLIKSIVENDSSNFGGRLYRELLVFLQKLFAILITCSGRPYAELFMGLIGQIAIFTNNAQEQETLKWYHNHIMSLVTKDVDINRHNVEEFLVVKRLEVEPEDFNEVVQPMDVDDTEVAESSNQSALLPPLAKEEEINLGDEEGEGEYADIDEFNFDKEEEIVPLPAPKTDRDDTLPEVVVGSEPWHSNFPSDWIPIITRDIERQKNQPPQPPFSDAYISGMSSKRRKLLTSQKLPTNVSALIENGVRSVIQTGDCSSSSSQSPSVDEVSASISSDPVAQSAYREALRTSIHERIMSDPDFTPERFPRSSEYFNKRK